MDINWELVASKIESLRKNKGLSREKLAQKCNISATTILRIERGQEPSSGTIAVIASELGVSIDYILGLTDTPTETISFDIQVKDRRFIRKIEKKSDGTMIYFPENEIMTLPDDFPGDIIYVMPDNTMEPKFLKNDYILMTSGDDFKNGDYVLVLINGKGRILKALRTGDKPTFITEKSDIIEYKDYEIIAIHNSIFRNER